MKELWKMVGDAEKIEEMNDGIARRKVDKKTLGSMRNRSMRNKSQFTRRVFVHDSENEGIPGKGIDKCCKQNII